jgi:hypothetical protein
MSMLGDIAVQEDKRKSKKDYKMVYTTKETWRRFRILAAEKEFTAHQALIYLMSLHEKNEQGKISNTVNVSIAR